MKTTKFMIVQESRPEWAARDAARKAESDEKALKQLMKDRPDLFKPEVLKGTE